MAAALAALPDVRRRTSLAADPRRPRQRPLVSANGRSALVTFNVPGKSRPGPGRGGRPARGRRGAGQPPGLLVAEAGDASIGQAIDNSLDFRKAEATSVPITLILLVVVFGALVAAGIPLLLAVTAVIAALAAADHPGPLAAGRRPPPPRWCCSSAWRSASTTRCSTCAASARNGPGAGRFAEALRIAAGTSGRAIVVSGLTVMIALAGLFLTGIDQFTGMAIGTIAVVGIAVTGSLTVLPALLSWLGPRADRGRIPFLGRSRAAARPSRLWAALVRRVVAARRSGAARPRWRCSRSPRPRSACGSATRRSTRRRACPWSQTMRAIQPAFPQAPSPAEVVVTGQDLTGPAVAGAITALQGRAAAGGPIREPVTATAVGGGAGR